MAKAAKSAVIEANLLGVMVVQSGGGGRTAAGWATRQAISAVGWQGGEVASFLMRGENEPAGRGEVERLV